MPIHRIDSGPDAPDPGVLQDAIQKIEAAGEEVVQVVDRFLSWPVGEWIVVTRGRGVERRSA